MSGDAFFVTGAPSSGPMRDRSRPDALICALCVICGDNSGVLTNLITHEGTTDHTEYTDVEGFWMY